MSQNPADIVEEEEEEDEDDEEEEEDALDTAINKTGCSDLAFNMQECMATKKDWRQCTEHVTKFKECMAKFQGQR